MNINLTPAALAALRTLVEDGEQPQDTGVRRELIESGVVDYVGGTQLVANDLIADVINVVGDVAPGAIVIQLGDHHGDIVL